jgi:hypothetical protein
MTTESVPVRFSSAAEIWGVGACNPRGIARALVAAIDEACEGVGSDGANDPAVHLILDHLCFIVGLPQPTLAMSCSDLNLILDAVKEKAGEKGKYL